MGAQKPGFYENIRCDTQIREKTRFLSLERSPLAPLKKGGTRVFKVLLQNVGIIGFKVPLLKGDLGGSRLGLNRQTEPASCPPGIDRALLV